jgi:hypothetical protein
LQKGEAVELPGLIENLQVNQKLRDNLLLTEDNGQRTFLIEAVY